MLGRVLSGRLVCTPNFLRLSPCLYCPTSQGSKEGWERLCILLGATQLESGLSSMRPTLSIAGGKAGWQVALEGLQVFAMCWQIPAAWLEDFCLHKMCVCVCVLAYMQVVCVRAHECVHLLSKLSVSTVQPPVSPEAVRSPSWVSAMYPERT